MLLNPSPGLFRDVPKMSIELHPRTGSNSGSEILCRTDMSYVEALHLVLFHLTVVNSKKFHDVENSVVPLLRRKLKALQVKLDYTHYGFVGKRQNVETFSVSSMFVCV